MDSSCVLPSCKKCTNRVRTVVQTVLNLGTFVQTVQSMKKKYLFLKRNTFSMVCTVCTKTPRISMVCTPVCTRFVQGLHRDALYVRDWQGTQTLELQSFLKRRSADHEKPMEQPSDCFCHACVRPRPTPSDDKLNMNASMLAPSRHACPI